MATKAKGTIQGNTHKYMAINLKNLSSKLVTLEKTWPPRQREQAKGTHIHTLASNKSLSSKLVTLEKPWPPRARGTTQGNNLREHTYMPIIIIVFTLGGEGDLNIKKF